MERLQNTHTHRHTHTVMMEAAGSRTTRCIDQPMVAVKEEEEEEEEGVVRRAVW